MSTMFLNGAMIKRSMIDVLVMFTVCCFSLSTLVYVAQGDADRVYRDFYRGAALAQAQLVQTTVESFLRLDLPLRHFAGFNALTDPLLEDGSAIDRVELLNDRGEVAFTTANATAPRAEAVSAGEEITLFLRGKFETVGSLVLRLRSAEVAARVGASFWRPWVLVLFCSFGFAFLTLATHAIAWERKRIWTAAAFAGAFALVAAVITVTLVGLYTEGASAKGKAILGSLSGRISDVTKFKISFDQLNGLDGLFADYRKLNQDISAIALVIDGFAVVHTDPRQSSAPWTLSEGTLEYAKDISEQDSPRSTKIVISMMKDVVYRQITDSIRNMLALFVASALFAYFSMSVARSLQQAREEKIRGQANVSNLGLGLIKPVFFLTTFIETLIYAFLPQYVEETAQASGVPIGYVSLPFIGYYLFFAFALLPAERMKRQYGPHKLILAGLVLITTGLLTLSGQFGFAAIVVARALSGAGQGLVFIGVQSYILDATRFEGRTRGASIIVIGFQAGMMSGMAIGSLLVSQLGTRGVFEFGAVVAAVTATYMWAFVPRVDGQDSTQIRGQPHPWRNIVLTLRDPRFLGTIWLIGIPAKAVLTGIILFALPLLLAKRGFHREDVGQITMMYGAAVIAASAWVAHRPHRGLVGILVIGALLSGVGLLFISSQGWQLNGLDVGRALPAALVVIAGVIAVGIGHGFINAPVITQVTGSAISDRLGVGQVAATYRLLERAGHTAGPMIVGQVTLLTGSDTLALGWIGGALMLFGMIFATSSLRDRIDRVQPETARRSQAR